VTTFEDPNREAVGLDPVWTGAAEGEPGGADAAGFDPADHTISEIWDHLDANPDERDAVIAAERAGRNRAGVVDG